MLITLVSEHLINPKDAINDLLTNRVVVLISSTATIPLARWEASAITTVPAILHKLYTRVCAPINVPEEFRLAECIYPYGGRSNSPLSFCSTQLQLHYPDISHFPGEIYEYKV